MKKYYSDEKNIQITIALLKKHGIRKIVASPGNTNLSFVASMQSDDYFEIYSSVDERSAAYIACGLSAESGEPVVLSCTGATASRNYLPGLTEAYYRKLPILAITSSRNIAEIGHHISQVIDRRVIPNDVAKLSVMLPIVKDNDDKWECEMKLNQAILELKRQGGGPVHINIPTTYSGCYDVKTLPEVRVINRICAEDSFPELSSKKVAVFVGAHKKWTQEQTDCIDRFCAFNDSVVFCDHTSNYKGKYRMLYSLVAGQQQFNSDINNLDVLIHIGETTGDYFTSSGKINAKEVWRVNEDGEIRDTFRKLRYVFQMPETKFFINYCTDNRDEKSSYLRDCQSLYDKVYQSLPNVDLPYSNIWMAYKMAPLLPENSVIHFGILNSLRSWNFFEIPKSVMSDSNVGGFGIDGSLSSLMGASLCDKEKIFFGVFGDLAFFYDINVMGNRHIGNNIRILLINNGCGSEFRLYCYPGARLGDDSDKYIAAAGHYGNKSKDLVRHYAEDLGFEYMTASNKEEFEQVSRRFITPELTDKPMLFEVFTDHTQESQALNNIRNILKTPLGMVKQLAKQVLGENAKKTIKSILNK